MKHPIPDKIAAAIRDMQAQAQRLNSEAVGMVKAAALIYGIETDFSYNLDTMTIETPEATPAKQD